MLPRPAPSYRASGFAGLFSLKCLLLLFPCTKHHLQTMPFIRGSLFVLTGKLFPAFSYIITSGDSSRCLVFQLEFRSGQVPAPLEYQGKATTQRRPRTGLHHPQPQEVPALFLWSAISTPEHSFPSPAPHCRGSSSFQIFIC